jgi:methylthioribose-1-phosphate isomerase
MRSVEFTGEAVRMLDQSALPHKESWFECKSAHELAQAVRGMRIRGPQAIGVAAAYIVAMSDNPQQAAELLVKTRPEATGISNATGFVLDMMRNGMVGIQAAARWAGQNDEKCKAISGHGASVISDKTTILTHCNAGALASGSAGTALGAICGAHTQGQEIFVYAGESRPEFGGSLTAWELGRAQVKHKVICDSAAGYLMRRGTIEMVMVGAETIAGNGDVANGIGTYPLSVLAKEHGVPFYVLSPTSEFDRSVEGGDGIRVVARDESGVLDVAGKRMYPDGTRALNPAFDITPAKNVTAWITERGVFRSMDELWEDAARG